MVGEQQGYRFWGAVPSDLAGSDEKQNMQESKEWRNTGLGCSQTGRHGLLASAELQPREGIAAPTSSVESPAVWGLTLTAFIFIHGNNY